MPRQGSSAAGRSSRDAAADAIDHLLALAPDPTVILDRDAVVVAASRSAGRLYGCAAAELVGRPLSAVVLQDVLDPDLRLSARRADGSEFPVEVSVRAFDAADAGGAPDRRGWRGPFLAVGIRDVTQRRRRADALREAADRRRLQAAEAERARWARELHDETLQSLAALHVLLSSGARAASPAQVSARIALAQEQIEDAMDNLRGLINDLRPPSLDELGLAASVQDLAERTQAAYGIEVDARVALPGAGDGPRRLAGDVETAAYRIVQEALSNAARHAGATRVAVELAPEPGDPPRLRVRVRDDGCGFDAAAREGAAGYGLRSMQERVDALRGELTLASAAGRGTEIVARLPLAPARADGGAMRADGGAASPPVASPPGDAASAPGTAQSARSAGSTRPRSSA